MESLKGSFLIASPGLMDPNFAKTVVFMVEHNDEGAFGLVISRPTETTLRDVCARVFEEVADPSEETLKKYPVYAGGPVQTSTVFFLHTLGEIGNERIEPGLFLGSQTHELRGVLDQLGNSPPPQFRIFFGYAGWAPGQLDREIEAGGWLVRQATLDQVFHPAGEQLWSELLRTFGGDLGILGMMPPDPDRN